MKPSRFAFVLLPVLFAASASAQLLQPVRSEIPVESVASTPELQVSVTPFARATWGTGDSRRFAQDWWYREQSPGGFDSLAFNHKFSDGWKLGITGRAVFGENDYNVALNFTNADIGFVRAGFVEYRKYFDDQAGYYPLFGTTSFSLDRDLHLNIGRMYVEAGLTLPNLPLLTIGWEEQFKDGNKSLLEWGGVTQVLTAAPGAQPTGSVTKRIFPSYEHINETTHILKAALEHTLLGIHLKDDFHYEWNNNNTGRHDMITDNLTTAQVKVQDFEEHRDHGAGFNTFTMDSRPFEKVYWSAGHLYSTMSGNYGLHLITDGVPFSNSDRFWFSNVVNLGEDSNVTDFNVMVGPYYGAILTGALRGEDTKNHGYANIVEANRVNLNGPIEIASSNTEKKEFEGDVGLRYVNIPMTTVYADMRLLNGQVDDTWLENGDPLGNINLVRQTDVWRQNYTLGFDAAPLSRVSLSGRYRYSIRRNNLGNAVDVTPDDGYPGLLTQQKLFSNDYMVKASYRATGQVQFFVSYQYMTTNVHTKAHDIVSPAMNPPLLVPATNMETGMFHSRTYSSSATWTPLPRLFLSGILNYQNTLNDAFRNDANAIQPYHGRIWSFVGSAGYAIDPKTDVSVEYSFVHALSYTDHLSDPNPPAGAVANDYGMPYGTRSEQHGLTVNWTRKFSERTIGRVGADYFNYHDSADAGLSNYKAYGIVAACTVRF